MGPVPARRASQSALELEVELEFELEFELEVELELAPVQELVFREALQALQAVQAQAAAPERAAALA